METALQGIKTPRPHPDHCKSNPGNTKLPKQMRKMATRGVNAQQTSKWSVTKRMVYEGSPYSNCTTSNRSVMTLYLGPLISKSKLEWMVCIL